MQNSLLSTGDKPVVFLSVSERTRAKEFYSSKLGLNLLYEDEYALVFDLGITYLRISELEAFQPQNFTVLGWEVADIEKSAKKLQSLNIQTKKYPGLDQTELGIWSSPSTAVKILWFEDPDGNLLSLSDPLR